MTVARVALIQIRSDDARAAVRAVVPPLGLLSLAAYARGQRPGRDRFRVWDQHFVPEGELTAEIAAFAPDLVGLSSLSATEAELGRLLIALRGRGLSCPIVLGGPLATGAPDRCLALEGIDAVVRGEGELPFVEMLDALAEARPLTLACGTSRRVGGLRVDTPAPEPIADLDALPLPAFDLVDLERYSHELCQAARLTLPPHRYAPLFTSRGCPYRCTYCHRLFGKRFRAQSPARVVESIERLHDDHGITNFHVFDDIFNHDSRRLLEICSRLERSRVPARLYFVNGVRADRLSQAHVTALAAAGTRLLSVAIETGSPRLQKLIGKHIDVARVLRTIEWGSEAGIFMNGFFMIGFPEETAEELESTFEVARSSRLDHAFFFNVVPAPGSELGDSNPITSRLMAGDYLAAFGRPGALSTVPETEFRAIVRRGLRRFWSPWRVASFVARYPDVQSLLLFSSSPRNLARVTNWVGRRIVSLPASWRLPVPQTSARAAPAREHSARLLGHLLQRVAEEARQHLPPPTREHHAT